MSVYFMKGISVILTAFNRRDYLNDALDSLINQDFDKTMMEIILVKNFSDKMIDDKIAEYGGKLVYSDGNFGRMVADAIELATKDIIAFLDDDDFFLSWKLRESFELFSKVQNLYLLHDSVINFTNINEVKFQHMQFEHVSHMLVKEEDLNLHSIRKLLKLSPLWHNSSFVINSDLLKVNLPLLRKVKLSADTFFFLLWLESKTKAVFLSSSLTGYRIVPHNEGNKEHFFLYKKQIQIWKTHLEDLEIFYTMFTTKCARNIIDKLYSRLLVQIIVGSKIAARNQVFDIIKMNVKAFALFFDMENLFAIFLIILYLLSPRLASIVYAIFKFN